MRDRDKHFGYWPFTWILGLIPWGGMDTDDDGEEWNSPSSPLRSLRDATCCL